MNMVDLIEKKRNGEKLSSSEIHAMIQGYVSGLIPDYQVSALLMAIYFKGFDEEETLHLTRAIINSGDTLGMEDIQGILVDKHSSGGVGDSVTLILGPILAACGLKVAKMSGRGLGFTGGTLDKLEAIPGVRVHFDQSNFTGIVNRIGVCICGQTGNLTPADKKLYALRDVTATVDIIPMIASSIMSKKLALRSDALVLDVKVGSGAFMKTEEEAEKLAQEMLRIGKNFGRNTAAVLTNMDEPLGYKIGNALEVEEAMDCLQGHWAPDMRELVYFIASELLMMTKLTSDRENAFTRIEHCIDSGEAFRIFQQMVHAQGGVREVQKSSLPKAAFQREVCSDHSGYVSALNAIEVGKVALSLGAGRETMDSSIDYTAGIELKKKVDDSVSKGEVLAVLYTDRKETLENAVSRLQSAYSFSEHSGHKKKMILKVL